MSRLTHYRPVSLQFMVDRSVRSMDQYRRARCRSVCSIIALKLILIQIFQNITITLPEKSQAFLRITRAIIFRLHYRLEVFNVWNPFNLGHTLQGLRDLWNFFYAIAQKKYKTKLSLLPIILNLVQFTRLEYLLYFKTPSRYFWSLRHFHFTVKYFKNHLMVIQKNYAVICNILPKKQCLPQFLELSESESEVYLTPSPI